MNIEVLGITILPVLYGCETWFVALRKERWLGAEENIFEPKV
jgi:hypothetical protein